MKDSRKIFSDMNISLDGFIAGEGVSSKESLGKGGDELIWYGDDINDINDENADLFKVYENMDAEALEDSSAREGAVIMGRNTFEVSIGE